MLPAQIEKWFRCEVSFPLQESTVMCLSYSFMLSEAQVDTWQHQNSCRRPRFARWILRSEAITHIISWSRAENLRKTWSVCLIKGVCSKSWSDYVRLFRCQGITLSFHLRLARSFLDCVGGPEFYWPHLQIELPILLQEQFFKTGPSFFCTDICWMCWMIVRNEKNSWKKRFSLHPPRLT